MKSHYIWLPFDWLYYFHLFPVPRRLSKETAKGTPIVNGDFYATIDGTQWNADSLQLALVSNNGFSITGLSKTGDQISMLLPDLKTGTLYFQCTLCSCGIISSNLYHKHIDCLYKQYRSGRRNSNNFEY